MRHLLVAALALPLTASLCAQSTTATCSKWFFPNKIGLDNSLGPVIFGDRFLVPAMRIHFVVGNSETPLPNSGVAIKYGWRWLGYPYPEHGWGAWLDAADQLECESGREGWIDVPSHEVKPRGWYDGKYTRFPWSRHPHFTEVEIVAVTSHGGSARTKLGARDLTRFADSDLVIHVFDGWRTELSWRPKGSGR